MNKKTPSEASQVFAAEPPGAKGALGHPNHPPGWSRSRLPSLIANLDFPAIPHSGIRGNKITDLFTLFVQLMR